MDKNLSDKIRVVSFLLIILVIFLHSYNLIDTIDTSKTLYNKSWVWFLQNFISFGLTRIAVPIFFILSGYLFFLNINVGKEIFFTKIKKRVKTLLIPFLFWSLFGLGFYFILQSIPQTARFFTKELIIDFSAQKFLKTIFINPIPYQLWFIRDLIVLVFISPIIYFCLNHFWKLTLLFFIVLWIFILNEFQNSIEAALFFLIGSFFSLHNQAVFEIKYEKETNFFFVTWLGLVLLKTTFQYYNFEPMLCTAIFKLSIIIGIIAFWGGYDVFYKKSQVFINKLLQISSFTFFIFASHEPILTVLKKVLFIALGKEYINYLEVYFLAPFTTIFICVLVGFFLKKNLKFIYDIITGGR